EKPAPVDNESESVAIAEPDHTPSAAADEESIEQLSHQWKSKWEMVSLLAADAMATTPGEDQLSQLAELIAQLTEIRERAAKLTPVLCPITELCVELQGTIRAAAKGLTEIIGEELNAPELLSLVASLPKETTVEKFEKASALQAKAQDAV